MNSTSADATRSQTRPAVSSMAYVLSYFLVRYTRLSQRLLRSGSSFAAVCFAGGGFRLPVCYNNLPDVNGAYPACYGYVSAAPNARPACFARIPRSMTPLPRNAAGKPRFSAVRRADGAPLPRDIKVMLVAAFLI